MHTRQQPAGSRVGVDRADSGEVPPSSIDPATTPPNTRTRPRNAFRDRGCGRSLDLESSSRRPIGRQGFLRESALCSRRQSAVDTVARACADNRVPRSRQRPGAIPCAARRPVLGVPWWRIDGGSGRTRARGGCGSYSPSCTSNPCRLRDTGKNHPTLAPALPPFRVDRRAGYMAIVLQSALGNATRSLT